MPIGLHYFVSFHRNKSELSKAQIIKYYFNRQSLPCLPTSLLDKSSSNNSVVALLLNAEQCYKEFIATSNPVRVKHNVRFLINLDELNDCEDLLSDDLGSWNQTKTKKKWYETRCDINGKVQKVVKVGDNSPDAFVVCRRPFVNASDRSLHKTIVDITHPDGKHHNIVFVKYEFVNAPEHEVKVKHHGNAKSCSIPYLRTYKSTRKTLEKNANQKGKGLKRAIHEVEMEVGDIANCNSVGALPRNERQAKYLKEKNSKGRIADPIFEITEKMKTEDKKFTRGYSLDDESPKVILFMDEQVEDIVNFCCNEVHGHTSLLYVDVTFQLGPFFVLVTTYRNTTLFTKRSNPPTCPVMLGPVMLCMLKDKATYLTLFQKISAQVPGLQVNLKGYCTDSEEALRQALAQVFPNSASLLCKVHAQKNIEEKCRKLRFSQSLTNEIVHDIFGSGGLVYADSYEEYNQKLNSLTEKWDRKEFKDSPEELAFSKYFRRYKAEEIWNHVTAKASKNAGFEDEVQANNISESANAFLKRWQDFQARDMASFIEDCRGLITKQRRDVQRALLGLSSPYILRPEYQGSVKGTDTFFDQQPGDRDNATNNLKAYVDAENFKKVYGHRPAPPKSQLNREDAAINLNALSDLFTEKDLRLLGEKAQRLCREKNIRAGFEKNCFLVKSESQQTPHMVKRLADNGYVCDKQCLGFKSRKICAHTVAVAAHNRNVTGYVKWYQQQEKKDNLTALTTFAVNKSAGAKKPARMRRNKSPDVMTQSSQLGRNTQTKTLGDLMASGDRSASRYTAETSSNQPLRITFRRSKPPKPAVQPTMNTPFELIGLTTRIKKCAAGCKGNIRDGPDNFSRGDIDNKFCIRHQEHDLVWIESQQKYKKTFENKHFHLYGNCIRARNPHFDPSQVNILSSLDSGDIEILKERLN